MSRRNKNKGEEKVKQFPKFIKGPERLIKLSKGDMIVYVFEDTNRDYNETEFKCSHGIRVTDFIKNLISKSKLKIDFFLEKKIKLSKTDINPKLIPDRDTFDFMIGRLPLEKAAIIMKNEPSTTNLDNISDFVYRCILSKNTDCPENLRVYPYDLRVPNDPSLLSVSVDSDYKEKNVIPFKEFIHSVPQIIKDIKSGRNDIYKEVLNQIIKVDDTQARNLLLDGYERAKSVYDILLYFDKNEIGEQIVTTSTLFDKVGVKKYKELLQRIVKYCMSSNAENFDNVAKLVRDYIETAKDISENKVVLNIIEKIKVAEKQRNVKNCYLYLHELLFNLGDIYKLEANSIISPFYNFYIDKFPGHKNVSSVLEMAINMLAVKGSENFNMLCETFDLFDMTLNRCIRMLYLCSSIMCGQKGNVIVYTNDLTDVKELVKFLVCSGFTEETFPVKNNCIDVSRFSSYDDLFAR
jgi:hypothetical protein